MEATDLIKALLEGFKAVAKTETIVGEGIKAGDFTVLPVSKISLGIGAGTGTEQIKTFLVLKEGEVSILNLRRIPAMIESFFGKVPEMVEKAVNILKGKKKGE
jgi:uncharacterized spore protein YtfJ